MRETQKRRDNEKNTDKQSGNISHKMKREKEERKRQKEEVQILVKECKRNRFSE